MKNRAMFFLLIYFFFVVINSFPQPIQIGDEDGNNWINYKEWYKVGLISGMIMGVSLAINYKPDNNIFETFNKLDNKLKDYKPAFFDLLELSLFFAHLDRISLYNITVGQLKDGLDEFYKDFSTRRIKIIDAIYVVKMQIEGKSPELIEAQILYLKRQPISEKEKEKAFEKYMNFNEKNSRFPEYKDIINGNFSKEDLLTIGIFISSNNKEHFLFCYGNYK